VPGAYPRTAASPAATAAARRSSALFPYTTLFRSPQDRQQRRARVAVTGGGDQLGGAVRRHHGADLDVVVDGVDGRDVDGRPPRADRKSTRLNSSHVKTSYAGFCLKNKNPANYGRL